MKDIRFEGERDGDGRLKKGAFDVVWVSGKDARFQGLADRYHAENPAVKAIPISSKWAPPGMKGWFFPAYYVDAASASSTTKRYGT